MSWTTTSSTSCRSSIRRSSSHSTSCSTPAAGWRGSSRRSSSRGCRAGRRACASRSTARFPNHEANPLIEENRRDIIERVIRERADIGIAWDGDADRCFFIDGTGEFIAGDFVTALLAEAFLLRHPGAKVVYDVRASYAVKDMVAQVRRHGVDEPGRPRVLQAAHARGGAIFGGEVTGHYYFRDNFFADNGFIPALLILELMSRKGQTLARTARAAARKVFHLGRDQHQDAGHAKWSPEKIDALNGALRRREDVHDGRRLGRVSRTGTSTCVPRTPNR